MTDRERAIIIEATISDLVAFRRGFARTKQGPFFPLGTLRALIEKGALRAYHPVRGKRGIRITAHA